MKRTVRRFSLSKSQVSQLPGNSGVYFLYQEGSILVYIGKALSLKNRVPKHDLDKTFTYVGYQLCHWSRARKIEKQFLDLYKKEHDQLPYYNKAG